MDSLTHPFVTRKTSLSDRTVGRVTIANLQSHRGLPLKNLFVKIRLARSDQKSRTRKTNSNQPVLNLRSNHCFTQLADSLENKMGTWIVWKKIYDVIKTFESCIIILQKKDDLRASGDRTKENKLI